MADQAQMKPDPLKGAEAIARGAGGFSGMVTSLDRGKPAQVNSPEKQKILMDSYAKYPFLADKLDDPQKLMNFIDLVHKGQSRNSPGTPADLWPAQKAQEALKELWGINAYTPKGFQEWSEADKRWYDPRKEAGGIDTEAQQ